MVGTKGEVKLNNWLTIVNDTHNCEYDYSLVKYTGAHNKVKILCKKHGVFEQTPQNHKRNKCPKCAREQIVTTKRNNHAFKKKKGKLYYITKCNQIHNCKYSYVNVPEDVGSKDKVDIICPDHGIFKQRMGDHSLGQGCPKCANLKRQLSQQHSRDYYIQLALTAHNNRYDYSLVVNDGLKNKVDIICPDHGIFKQSFDKHIYGGTGCPICGNRSRSVTNGSSQAEIKISNILDELGIDYVKNDRTVIAPKELDFYIPTLKIALEFNGLYWHSEQLGKDRNYHRNKQRLCNKQGIRLIQIFEDEWTLKKPIVITKLRSLLGRDDRKRVYARKCEVKPVTTEERKSFLNQYHIQGDGKGSITLGLYNDNELVALVSFIALDNKHYLLNRFATKHHVIGGFSKLLKYFQLNFDWTEIVSFADLRWSDGNLYTITGWQVDKVLPPDYSYINNNKRVHKFNYRRKYLPKLLSNFDPNLSERENCNNNGILRIWDCGKIKFKITKQRR